MSVPSIDRRAECPASHVRPMIQLIDDLPPGSSEGAPRWSGEARWPHPVTYNDLELRVNLPPELPARLDVSFAPAVS